MLVCQNCNNQQDDGKFCGVCGGAVEEMVASTEQPNENVEQVAGNDPVNESIEQESVNVSASQGAATVETQAQPTAEAIKSGLSNYWSYFINLIKNPSRAFQTGENQFINGLITLGLYALLFSLSLYFLANTVMNTFGGWYSDESIPFFSVVSRLFIFAIIILGITFGSAFAMIKIAKNHESFKTIITQYGSVIVPFTALNVIAMLGGLIGSIQLTMYSLLLSVLFTVTFIPVLFVYEKVSAISKNGQKIYLSLATIIMISLISFILGDALLMNLLESIDDTLYYLF